MELKELIESFEGFNYGKTLKQVVERIKVSIDEEPMEEHTLVYKEPWEHIEISREEVTWLNKKLPEWSEEYEDIAGRQNDKTCYF